MSVVSKNSISLAKYLVYGFIPQKCQHIVRKLKDVNIYKAMEGCRKILNEQSNIDLLTTQARQTRQMSLYYPKGPSSVGVSKRV
jgi:hypothetical protein